MNLGFPIGIPLRGIVRDDFAFPSKKSIFLTLFGLGGGQPLPLSFFFAITQKVF